MQIKADVGNVFNDFYQFISNPNPNFIVTLCSGVSVLETLRLVVYKLGLYREFLVGKVITDGSMKDNMLEIFRHTCLQSHLETSPPTPHKSYTNPRTTFEIFKNT